MKTLLALLLLLLTGCAAFNQPELPVKSNTVLMQVTLSDDLPAGINGYADWSGPVCMVTLRAAWYLLCLPHEADHCFRGAWHGRTPNSSQCGGVAP